MKEGNMDRPAKVQDVTEYLRWCFDNNSEAAINFKDCIILYTYLEDLEIQLGSLEEENNRLRGGKVWEEQF